MHDEAQRQAAAQGATPVQPTTLNTPAPVQPKPLVVYGALSTHRQTDPDKLTIPVFARSLIYETKTVRGFWLFRWFTETPKDRMAAAIDRTLQLADSGVLRVATESPPCRSVHRRQRRRARWSARAMRRCSSW